MVSAGKLLFIYPGSSEAEALGPLTHGGPATHINNAVIRATLFISTLQCFTSLEHTETSEVVFMPDKREWWETVDPERLSEDTRYRILAYVVERHGREKVLEETGISRVTLWRLLERKSPVKPEYVKLLKLLSMEEFEELVTSDEDFNDIGEVSPLKTTVGQNSLFIICSNRHR